MTFLILTLKKKQSPGSNKREIQNIAGIFKSQFLLLMLVKDDNCYKNVIIQGFT